MAEAIPANINFQQALQRYEGGEYNVAISLLKQALRETSNPKEQANLHHYIASSYRELGELESAIAHWQKSLDIYNSLNDSIAVARSLTQQAQAYSYLGQNTKAIKLLQSALEIASKESDPILELITQGALGNAYRSFGDYEEALEAHLASLNLAQTLNNPNYITSAWNNLGNLYLSRAKRHEYQVQVAEAEKDVNEVQRLTQLAVEDRQEAKKAYRESVQASQQLGGMAEVKALLNLSRLLEESSSTSSNEISQLHSQTLNLLTTLPNSQDKAYAFINLASQNSTSLSQQIELLENALLIATEINDSRAQSFALGTLGRVYETANQYDKAMELTRQAQFAGQKAMAADSLYRWQWQGGRILTAQEETEKAISAYEQSIATLQTIRGDILAANQELQFDFRDSVEPVYRELITLLLQQATSATKASNSIDETRPLKKVLDTVELLKLAELQNFFGDECVQVAQSAAENSVSLANTNAAVIYSVILDEQAAMILQRPDSTLKIYPLSIPAKELQTEVDELRLVLEDQSTEAYIGQAKKVYDLLIKPLETDLAEINPDTLVFVQDGVLRKVPMSALFDGDKFLIEKYPIANTPSLSLTNYSPANKSNLSALALGLTLERSPFAALPNVSTEVDSVQKILGGIKLVDEEFTLSQLQTNLDKESYSVIHLATHGKFGVDANSTFLVAYDQNLSIEEIDKVLRSNSNQEPIELLTMSACQTAAGDNRSALGIAGVAVRAGVKSALASLWYISDEATVPLIEEFYTQLKQPGITKAEALREAQIKLINDPFYGHPALWSPLVLIGNWS